MQIVKSYTELVELNLPIQHKDSLITHLAESFQGKTDELKKNWEKVGITLVLIDEGDTDHELSFIDGESLSLIEYVISYPEYVLILEPFVIGLAILNDHGSGCYLVGHTNSETSAVKTLLTQVTA